ncbi:MAG: VWA domain-containing protein [Christensenellales bacterium]
MKLRRIFSLFIAAALVFSLLPLGAIATDQEELISGPVAAPSGGGEQDPGGNAQPDKTIEIPEDEPEGDDPPLDVIGKPGEDNPGETPQNPGAGDPAEGGDEDPHENPEPEEGKDPGAIDGEEGEDPDAGDPAEGGDEDPDENPEQSEEGEDPDAEEGKEDEDPDAADGEDEDVEDEEGEEGAEGEEGTEDEEDEEGEDPAEEVDVTTLFGEELARYIEELEANEDYDALKALLTILTEEQVQSLIVVETTSLAIAALLRSREEKEIIKYYPFSNIPVGPIIRGNSGALDTAGRMMAGMAGFGMGLLSEPTLPDYVKPPEGMTVTKTATEKDYPGGGSNDRQYFQLDLTITAQSIIIDDTLPADIVLVLDVSGSMADYVYTRISYENLKTNEYYYIKIGSDYYEVEHHSRRGWIYWWYDPWWGWLWDYAPADGEYYDLITKIQALKNSVISFLASVLEKSPDSRVAIVTYASSSEIETGDSEETALLSIKGSGGGLNSNLTSVINGLSAYGATRADLGFRNATKILQADDQTDRNRVVIHFTDGVPTTSSSFDNQVAADSICWAKVLKNDRGESTGVSGIRFPATGWPYSFGSATISPTTGCGATVYTIGIFPANVNNKVHEYMWRCSSNIKDGSAPGGSYLPNTGSGYYQTADSEDTLDDIFQKISREIGKPIENVTIRDYIDPNFELCDSSGNKITNTNSDAYGTYVEWADVNIQPGKTFTRTIYVKPKDDFIGGNNLLTNIENISAVYNGDEILASFPMPTVNVPIRLGTGEYSEAIYLGDAITQEMVTRAEDDLLTDIFKGNDYSTIGTVEKGWTDNPEDQRPTAASNSYGYSVTVTPNEPEDESVGNKAVETDATGTFTVNVHGATLSATGWTILKGQTAVLDSVVKTLTWNQKIEGKDFPNDVTYKYFNQDGTEEITSWPVLTAPTTYMVKAIRSSSISDIVVASDTFKVDIAVPGFNGETYHILQGMKLSESEPAFTFPGITIDYSEIEDLIGDSEYDDDGLTYTPSNELNADYEPKVDEEITVTVEYRGIEIGSATVIIDVHEAGFSGNNYHLLYGEQALADGYNEGSGDDGYGVSISYPSTDTGYPEGFKYNQANLSFEHAEHSAEIKPNTRLTENGTNLINVKYNGTVIAENIPVEFNVHAPGFEGSVFDLFYGETVGGSYTGINSLKDAIKIKEPTNWNASGAKDAATRWTAYEASIQCELAEEDKEHEGFITKVYLPGEPSAQFPVTMKYEYEEDGVKKTVTLAMGEDAPQIIINVTAGQITINKTVTIPEGMDSIDLHQTFLFKITRTATVDGASVKEEFYEYITGNGEKTITGLKYGTYEVNEMTSWSWRYQPEEESKTITLGRTSPGTNDPFTSEGSASFTNEKITDAWLGDEAPLKKNDCGTVPAPSTQTTQEAAILPGKRNGLIEEGPTEEARG